MRNKTWKSIFSVLLAIALLLPMAPVVRADEDVLDGTSPAKTAESVTLTADKKTIYWRSGKAGTVTVTADVTPKDCESAIQWTISPSNLQTVESSETVSEGKATIKLQATQLSVGNTISVTAEVDGKTGSVEISVEEDKMDLSTAAYDKSLSIEVDKTAQMFKTPPRYLSGDLVDVTYTSSDTTIATVDTSGKITAVKPGTATITAKVDTQVLTCEVTVKARTVSSTLTGSVTLGNNFSMRPIYDKLNTDFSSAYGHKPTTVIFPNLGKVNGTLKTTGGNDVVPNDRYNFDELHDMYLVPSSKGDFTCAVTVMDGSNNTLSGTITVSISIPSHTILIPIDGSANYSFSKASTETSGKTGAQLVKDALGTFGSIKFTGDGTGNVGTLYTGNPPSSTNRVYNGIVVPFSQIDELYFTPTRAGTFTIPFTAYSTSTGTGSVLCEGSIILSVDGSSLDITYSLDSVSPYTFSLSPSSTVGSLYTQFLNAINASFGGTSWKGIRFDGAAKASTTGTLHQSSAYTRAISASEFIPKTSISSLYYVPERAGIYEITYGIYADESSTTAMATGKLTIKTSTIPDGVSDITYATVVKGSVTLEESDFIDFFQTKNGNKYQLSYVVFEEYDGGGTFYYDKSSFLPYNSADYYSSTYTGSVAANARYLDRLSFTAPSASGYTAVLFTCYGGTTANSAATVTTGKLCIFYTASDVPAVTYNAFNVASVDFKEADFVTAYSAATKSSVSRPSFSVQFLNAPGKGTLYYYYSGSSRRALTSSNIANYTFSVNDKSGVSVENLTYVPTSNGSGTEEIAYLVTSASGEVLYVGTVQLKLSTDLTLYVTNDGSNFQLADFYNASDRDPVLYVTFPQPTAGKVYVSASGRYIVASADTKLYTASSADGQYPLTSAFYAPKANETGTASLKCVLHRKSGATTQSTITLNILNKASSGTFGDVTGAFSWAANSIDFASKIGLVNGTQLNPPLFSPGNTMRRSDFVLMLYRLAGSPAVSGTAPYTDISSGKYYYNSAVWAYNKNIMRNVTTGGLYNPEGALTRQDFAQILFNYATAMGESTANSGSISSYVDAASVSANTREGVTWAVAKGYITSASTDRLVIEPARAATRAEISTLLHRYLTY